MKNISYLILLIAIVSCKFEAEESQLIIYEATEISIKYTDEIKKGDWIQIDSYTFIHQVQDTLNKPTDVDYGVDNYLTDIPLNENSKYVPASIFYTRSVGIEKWAYGLNLPAQIAFGVLWGLREFEERDGYPIDDRIYSITNNEFDIYMGWIKFKRNDGAKITVKTSKNYGAIIEEVK